MRKRVTAAADAILLAFGTIQLAKRGEMSPTQAGSRPVRRPPPCDTRDERFVEATAHRGDKLNR